MDIYFSFKEIISAFMVLFAVIDILGAIPIIISLREKNQKIEAGKAAIISFVILVAFLFIGQALLIAGAASFTTLLSLRAEYNILNIIIAVAMNMALVYLVLRYVYYVERLFGKSGVYVMRKLFGIILLAIAVRLFTSNLTSLIGSF